MGWVNSGLRRLGGRVGSMGRLARVAAVALVAMMLVGGFWLAGSAGDAPSAGVFGRAVPAADLAAAQRALAEAGIACVRGEGDLLVKSELLARARAVLAERHTAPPAEAESFQAVAAAADLWSTESQKAQRWQAAKMATLSQLICKFPAVRSAAVILDTGSPRRLGRPAVSPTAAVELCLADGATVTPDLIDAVADLVAGSIAGMERGDVRIVDSAGRSYWAGAGGDDALAAVRQAESHYARKIAFALDYVAGAIIAVHVQPGDSPLVHRIRAVVSVPESYLRLACDAGRMSDAEFSAAAQGHLARLRQVVAPLIGARDAGDVQVDWYRDAPAESENAPRAASSAPAIRSVRYAVVGGFVVVAAGLLVVARMRRRARATAVAGETDAPADADEPADESPADPLAFLRELEEDQLLAVARDEQPQAVALIISRVTPARAAAVLASLPAATQAQVVRQLAALGELDQAAVEESASALASRVVRLAGDAREDGCLGRIAEILHHAGYHTECRVLDALGGIEPQLAESLRTRMFAFEDIVRLPSSTLRTAMEDIAADEIAIALRTAGKELRKKVLGNLATGAARGVRREMDRIGPVRLSDVEAAQQRIVEAVRQARYGRYVGHAHHVGKELLA